jgi:Lrp/AsnC family leucine-responsive transcriptional regulator
MDRIDRQLIAALLADGRATFQDLGRTVRLSPNTVADRVRRLRRNGVLTGFHADLDLSALGRSLTLLSDVRLREGVDRLEFEHGLRTVPQIVSAMHITGEYDYALRIVCAHPAEFETIIDLLKRDHGVRDLRTSLLLREVSLGPAGLLDMPLPD